MIKNAIPIVLLAAVCMACTFNSLDEQPMLDCSTSTLDFTATTTDATCSQSDGSIVIAVTAGMPPYFYLIDDGQAQSSALFENLSSGIYEITVIDSLTCSITKEIAVASTGGFQAIADVTLSGCNATNGTITVLATNGTKPYAYKLNNGTEQSASLFSNLGAGEYDITVTDALGCDFSIVKSISTGISYDASVKPIIMNNCAISGCHNGTNNLPDFSVFSNVQSRASSIKTRTQSGNMPKNGSITQAEKDAIACWVDDGAEDN